MAQVRLGRPKKPLVLSANDKEQLRGIGQSRALPNGVVRRGADGAVVGGRHA
jgi:hypothetical protein